MKRRTWIICIASAAALLLAAFLLQRRDAGQDSDEAEVAALTVEVTSPVEEQWPQQIKVSGPITAWQEVVVSPETGGLQVTELLVDVGAVVQRGQTLARLSGDSVRMDLRKQQAAVGEARATLDQADSELRRARIVEASGVLSKQQLEQYFYTAARAKATLASAIAGLNSIELRLRQTQVVAPTDGYVSSKSAVVGDVANAGVELFRLVREGRVEWRPELDAAQLGGLAIGQRAEIWLPGGQQVSGIVRDIGPTLSGETGRAVAYVRLEDNTAVAPGLFASGQIVIGQTPATTLPEAAVVARDGRTYVYLVDPQERVYSQVVNVGRRLHQRVELLTTLPDDARVVSSGGAFLSERSRVRVATNARRGTGGAK